MSNLQLSNLQLQLAEAIINYVAGSGTREPITSIIGEDEWDILNAQYHFSSDSYDTNNNEYEIVAKEFPNL
jgi:hypothetical protein